MKPGTAPAGLHRILHATEIISRGTLRGRMPLARLSLSQSELAFAQLALHMASSVTVLVVHGMQEVSGSSPLSSTQVKSVIRIPSW